MTGSRAALVGLFAAVGVTADPFFPAGSDALLQASSPECSYSFRVVSPWRVFSTGSGR